MVSGNWVLVGDEIPVKMFNPKVARAYHEVVKSINVINRAFKAQLQYTNLLKPGSRRVLSLEEISDLEVNVLEIHRVVCLRSAQGKPVPHDLNVDHSDKWRIGSKETLGLWRKNG